MARQRAIQRFWKYTVKVDEPDGCWLWIGATDRGGYGKFSVDGSIKRAHRWIYVQLIGDIPSGMQMHHTCDVMRCVNPSHLIPVTPAVHVALTPNNRTFQNAQRTHCIHGHPFDEDNTYVAPGSTHRECRACKRERNPEHVRQYRERRRARMDACA